MKNYDIEIEEALKNKVLEFSEIYDFRDTPYESLISDFYNFCRENIDIHGKNVNINPNVLIFNNHLNSNAFAMLKDGVFSISINVGLFKKCDTNFLNNQKLDEQIEKRFNEITSKLDNKISGLGFQIATNFTYYHELAHLFQFTKKNENLRIKERVDNDSTYHLQKHYLEINADSFAAIALASHISQYLEKSFGQDLNQDISENVIVILGACILNHIANFHTDISKIYLKEKTHPHPFLRIFNVILSLTNYLNQSEFLKERGIEIETYKVFKMILDFYEELEREKVFNTNFSTAMDEGAKIQDQISKYLGQLVEFNESDYNNALELWNKHIS